MTGWMNDAACKGMPTAMFFPRRGADVRAAKLVCRGCPVRFECLEYAMDLKIKQGIFGGKSERQRRSVRPTPTYEEIMAERNRQAYELHQAGFTTEQISRRVGCGISTARKRVRNGATA